MLREFRGHGVIEVAALLPGTESQLARTGWYKAVRIKGEATHIARARLKIREQLVAAHRAMARSATSARAHSDAISCFF